jgi:hypothetical protein
MLDRWESRVGPLSDPVQALDHLEGYVRWLLPQRLGSIFEAFYDRDGLLVPRKVSDHLPRRAAPLPE